MGQGQLDLLVSRRWTIGADGTHPGKIRDIYVVILALLALVFPRASVRFPWLPLLGATPGSGSCLFSRVKESPAGFQRSATALRSRRGLSQTCAPAEIQTGPRLEARAGSARPAAAGAWAGAASPSSPPCGRGAAHHLRQPPHLRPVCLRRRPVLVLTAPPPARATPVRPLQELPEPRLHKLHHIVYDLLDIVAEFLLLVLTPRPLARPLTNEGQHTQKTCRKRTRTVENQRHANVVFLP